MTYTYIHTHIRTHGIIISLASLTRTDVGINVKGFKASIDRNEKNVAKGREKERRREKKERKKVKEVKKKINKTR